MTAPIPDINSPAQGEAVREPWTVLDLFSAAAGGWSLGMHRAGYRTIAACEVIDWRRALYAQNNPGVLIYGDILTLTRERLVRDLGRLPDIIVGSPPCQDISSANTKGLGVDGSKSRLFFEAVRLIGECRPRWFALENSDRVRTRGYDRIAAALEELGYPCWPLVVGAGNAGASHKRKRCFIIGMDPDASCEQARIPGQPWLDADADMLSGQASGPASGWRERRQEETIDALSRLETHAYSDELWVESRGRGGEIGTGETLGWLSRIFRGPPRAEPLSSHFRAYDGLPSGLAEQCRQAYGDAVFPDCAEAIGRAIWRVESALQSVRSAA